MRPRPKSRGNRDEAHERADVVRAASMRPRPKSRGNSSCAKRGNRNIRSFNEAAAEEPRKLLHTGGPGARAGRASMRPRPKSRGNARTPPGPGVGRARLQ